MTYVLIYGILCAAIGVAFGHHLAHRRDGYELYVERDWTLTDRRL